MGSLDALLGQLEQWPEKTLLILHNFDELQPGGTSGYDDGFFELLNGIHDRSGLSLLCVSEHLRHNWLLQLEEMHLPPLTKEQIMDELRRRGVAEPELPKTAGRLLQQKTPYVALGTLHPET